MPPTLQKTRGGAPKLSEQAKLLVVPQDIVSTMWPSVLKTCVEKLGADFDPWQDGAGRGDLRQAGGWQPRGDD